MPVDRSASRATLDTNVAIYAFDDSDRKGPLARLVLVKAAFISVQLLNEFANVTVRKRKRGWGDAAWGISRLRAIIPDVRAIQPGNNSEALRIADRYRLSFYDALMLAVALSGGARTFYSEDMQHDLLIDDTLRIADPFRQESPAR